jgi:hypothetical protein
MSPSRYTALRDDERLTGLHIYSSRPYAEMRAHAALRLQG